MRGRLVEEQNRGGREQRAGERQALALSAGETVSVLADPRVEAVGERLDPLVELRAAEGVAELVAAGVPRKQAAEIVSRLAGLPRNRLYARSL